MPRIRVIVDVRVRGSELESVPGALPDPILFAVEVDGLVADLAGIIDFREDVLYGRHTWPRPLRNEDGTFPPREGVPAEAGVLLRGTIADDFIDRIEGILGEIWQRCAGIVVDLPIDLSGTTQSAPLGDVPSVRQLHSLDALHHALSSNGKRAGTGVAVAIVDSGLNLSLIQGAHPDFSGASINKQWSWSLNSYPSPGTHPPGHGTACACDALVGAPNAELIDIAVIYGFKNAAFQSFLSDIIIGYLRIYTGALREVGRSLSGLVISNSWTGHYPHLDFPVGHPLNYHSNPKHMICAFLDILDLCGADSVFAAGNCSKSTDSTHAECRGTISGSAALDSVLTVSSVDLSGVQIQNVCRGPGTIKHEKPDLAAATDFYCSNTYRTDKGTSASCAVAAGAIAAIRTSVFPYGNQAVSPGNLRDTLRKHARPFANPSASLHEHGAGILDVRPIIPGIP